LTKVKEKKKEKNRTEKKAEDLKNFGKHARECRQASDTRIRKTGELKKKNERQTIHQSQTT
jgi:hypothetical protein